MTHREREARDRLAAEISKLEGFAWCCSDCRATYAPIVASLEEALRVFTYVFVRCARCEASGELCLCPDDSGALFMNGDAAPGWHS